MQKCTNCFCKTFQPRSCLPVFHFCSSLPVSCTMSQDNRVVSLLPAVPVSPTHGQKRDTAQGEGGFCLRSVWVDFTVLFLQMLMHVFAGIHFPLFLVLLWEIILFLQWVFFPCLGDQTRDISESPSLDALLLQTLHLQPALCPFLPSAVSQPFPTLLAK